MKPKIVEVDANSPRPERAVGDAPSIGKVAKVSPEDAELKGETDDGYADDEEEKEPGDWLLKLGMISGLVLLVLFATGLIYFSVVRKLDFGKSNPADGQAALAQSRSHDEAAMNRGLSEGEAIDLVRRALAVRFTSQVKQSFRLSASVDAMSAVGFLRELPQKDGLIESMEYLPAVEHQGVMLERVRVHCSKGGAKHSRDAFLIESLNGDWKIDFDSFARRVDPSWETLLAKGGGEGLVRVMVQRVETDTDTDVQYELQSPDLVASLGGRVTTDSAVHRHLESHLGLGGEAQPMTLRVKAVQAVPRGDFPSLRILHVVSPSWVVLEADDTP